VEKPLLEDLNEAAAKVTAALNELLGYVKQGPEVSQAAIPHAATMEVITESTRTLCQAPEPAEMIRQAKILAQATAELVKGLKSEAEGVTDKDLQRRLLAASKQLAEATTRLVEAAKVMYPPFPSCPSMEHQ
jgi:talin